MSTAGDQPSEAAGGAHGVNGRGGALARAQGAAMPLARLPRDRILQALVEVLAERGFAGATVGLVVGRAGVSTRTFYKLFNGLEECLIAIMDGALERALALASRELEGAECWQDGVRAALAAVLRFFDGEPELACVCIVETLAGGPVVLAHRERLIEVFFLPVLERVESEVPGFSPAPLAARGVMSLVLGLMHAHLVTGKPGPLIELLGPLMGLLTAPSLDVRGVEREIEQGDELARAILAADSRRVELAQPSQHDAALAAEREAPLPAILGGPGARRARECLLFLAEQGGRGLSPSNREIAVGIDIAHQSQISTLLACLLQEGLLSKRSEGKGKRNAWRLTPRGEELARAVVEQEA